MTEDFETWISRYLGWRKLAVAMTSLPIPTDPAALSQEQQELEPLYSYAEEFRATAEYHARAAVEDKRAKRARIAWAQEDTAGRCRVIASRAMKVAQQVKMQETTRPR